MNKIWDRENMGVDFFVLFVELVFAAGTHYDGFVYCFQADNGKIGTKWAETHETTWKIEKLIAPNDLSRFVTITMFRLSSSQSLYLIPAVIFCFAGSRPFIIMQRLECEKCPRDHHGVYFFNKIVLFLGSATTVNIHTAKQLLNAYSAFAFHT